MIFRIRELRRAQADIHHIVNWLANRSPRGARAWLDAYDAMVARLEKNADSLGFAQESEKCEFEIRQAPFKTSRGRVYRALFLIEGNEVFILRVRGPGQAPVQPEDFA